MSVRNVGFPPVGTVALLFTSIDIHPFFLAPPPPYPICCRARVSWLIFQVGCDASCLRVVSVLLRDLLAADSMTYHHAHVVIVVPQEPTLAWDALLCLQSSFTVTYLNGDLRCV